MASTQHKGLSNKIRNWNFPLIIQTWIFFLIILFFHLLWENFEFEIATFQPFILFNDAIGNFLLTTSPSIINPMLDVDITRNGISLILPSGLSVTYYFNLSGIKQMCLVIILFLIVPGPWMKKLWFIPVSLIIVQITVFVRFIMVIVNCLVQPEQVNFLLDVLFGPLFFVEFLILWLAWILLVAKTVSFNHPSNSNLKN